MLNVTSTWKTYLLNEDYELYLLISYGNVTNAEIPNSHILQNSFSMNRFSTTGNTIEIGSATSMECQFTIDNSDGYFDDFVFEGAQVHIKLRHFENKGTENETSSSINIGVAYVDEVIRQQDSIQLVLLDKMVQLDKPVGTITYSTPQALISKIETDCGITYNGSSSNPLNMSVSIATPTSNNLTYRQLLQWVCQVTGTCAYIDENETLVLRWYGKDAAGDADKLTVSDRFSSEIDRESITITGVSAVVGEQAYSSSNNSDYVISIEGNEFISADNASTIISGIASRFNNFTYYPFSAQTMNLCWLQPLDKTVYTDKSNVDHEIIITDWTFSPGHNLSLAGKGESATRKGYASNPPFTAAQTRIIEEIKKNVPQVQVDDKISAVFALNEAVNNGKMMYSTTVNGVKYYHDDTEIADSSFIAAVTSNGIGWTNSGWNSGNPSFTYGLNTSNASAILESLYATRVNADLINAGQVAANRVDAANLIAQNLEIKDGSNNVIHSLNNANKSVMLGGENGITYNANTQKITLGSNVYITGNLAIGQALSDAAASAAADAVEELHIVGIDNTVVDYTESSSNDQIPQSGWSTTIPTVSAGNYLWTRTTIYYTDHTQQDPHTDVAYSVARQGQNGQNGAGVTISSILYGTSESESTEPSSYGAFPSELTPGTWLWTKTTYSDNTTSTTKTYQGLDGRNGINGVNGSDGINGTSSYIYIRYSEYENGLDANNNISYTAIPNANTVYIGVYVSSSPTAPSNDQNPYTWSLFRGADGDEGTPGTNGIDGTSEYVHFAYSSGANGSGTFSTSPFTGAKYLGVRHDDTATDSQTPSDYQWTLIMGATVSVVEYVSSSSGTTTPSDSASWSTTMPSVSKGYWLWTRITYTDGSKSYSKSYQGKDGSNGSTISTKTVEYAISSDGANPPPDNQQSSGQLTYTSETWYCASDNSQYTITTLKNALQSDWNASGIVKNTKICALPIGSIYKHVFSFTRTDYSDGTYEISNVAKLGTYGGSGSSYSVTETFYVIASSSSAADDKISTRTQFLTYYDGGAGTEVNDRISALQWTSSNQFLFSFDVTCTRSNAYIVGTKTSIAVFGSTAGSFEAEKWYIAQNTSSVTSSTRSAVMSNWYSSVSRSPRFFETSWGASNQYLKSLNVTVSKKGVYTPSDFTLEATYGTSYPTFENVASSGTTIEYWSTTVPDVSTNKGKYLWTKTTFTYSSGDPLVQYGVQYIPTDGEGKGITTIVQYYKASTNGTTAPTSGWVTTPSSAGFNATNKYLWTYTRTNFTNSTYTETSPYVIGVWGQDGSSTGSPGRGIANIEHQYALSSSNSYSNRPTSGWSETPPTYEANKYYWERDKITWTDSTVSYTDAVLSAGTNEAIRLANELNPDYAEFIIRENGQVFIDGEKIYAGTITVGALASKTGFIESLLSENISVNGSIGVSGGDIVITSEPKTSPIGGMDANFLNSYCQTNYSGATYDQLNPLIKPFAYMKAVAAYILQYISTATTGSKLVVKNQEGTKISAMYPNALVVKDTSNAYDNSYSYYGESAFVGKDLLVKGSMTSGNIQKGQIKITINNSNKTYQSFNGSATFKSEFTNVPVVVCSPSNTKVLKRMAINIQTTSTTGFSWVLNVDGTYEDYFNSYGTFDFYINWIAIS